MDANLEALKRIEAAIEVEMKRHRRNLSVLTNAAELLRTLVGDKAGVAEVTVEVIRGANRLGLVDKANGVARSSSEEGFVKGKPTRKSTSAASSNSARRIVNIEAPTRTEWGRTAGATAAIKEAIAYFGDEAFTTSEILTHVRQHRPQVTLDPTTVAQRIFQLRKAGFIDIVVSAKPGTRGPQTYKRTPT